MCSKEPLFPGKSEIDQLQLILKTMGSPTEDSWPGEPCALPIADGSGGGTQELLPGLATVISA